MVTTRADFWSGTTARARRFKSPLRDFLRTESGGAAVLLAATAAALVWVNVDASSYEELWAAVLAIDLDGNRIELTLREWVNSGLMTFFFFVLGLEARREFDLGDLRERRRFVLPLLASVGGMVAAVAIFLAFNLGSSAAEGWGIAMSTDTAFALGLLTLFGRRAPDRLRAFMHDDIASIEHQLADMLARPHGHILTSLPGVAVVRASAFAAHTLPQHS